jgi:hypothetical protein
LSPSQLLKKYDPKSDSTISLTILQINTYNPPEPFFDSTINTELKAFLPLFNSQNRPIEFMDSGWRPELNQRGGAAVANVYSLLKSMPTVILETEFIGQKGSETEKPFFNVNCAYWGLDGSYQYGPVISKVPLDSFTNNEEIREFICLLFKLVIGICADAHYTKHYSLSPLLPRLIGQVIQNLDENFVPLVEKLVLSYCDSLEQLGEEYMDVLPDWELEIAENIVSIPVVTRKVVERAITNYINMRNTQPRT